MSQAFEYQIIEIPVKLFAGKLTERTTQELRKVGPLGWELVSAVQAHSMEPLRLFLKRPIR